MKDIIPFKKERDLGEILNDTFRFLRQNGKELFGYIFRIAGPALLIMIVGLVIYTQSISSTIGNVGNFGGLETFTFTFIIAGLILIVSGLAYYALLYGVINHYIKSYIKNEGLVVKEEITSGVRNDFWSLVGLNILVGLMIAGGTVLCVAPGIYLGISLVATYSILIIEKRSVTDTIGYSFQLIKGEWWMTFITLFVMGILYYIMAIIFQIPQYVYFFFKAFTNAESITSDPTAMFDIGYTILNAIGMIGQYLGYTLISVATVFVYYNLNEKKNQTGTLETIETLGSSNDDDTIIRY